MEGRDGNAHCYCPRVSPSGRYDMRVGGGRRSVASCESMMRREKNAMKQDGRGGRGITLAIRNVTRTFSDRLVVVYWARLTGKSARRKVKRVEYKIHDTGEMMPRMCWKGVVASLF